MKRWLALAITLFVMGLIFFLSAQPGAVSSGLSGFVTQQVQSSAAANAVTPNWFSANANANVRKWAHVYVYCALGLSTAVTVHAFMAAAKRRCRRPVLWGTLLSFGICLAYAGTDELHQHFVPGRAAMWEDIVIDALGFTPCLLLVSLCVWLWQRRKQNN